MCELGINEPYGDVTCVYVWAINMPPNPFLCGHIHLARILSDPSIRGEEEELWISPGQVIACGSLPWTRVSCIAGQMRIY